MRACPSPNFGPRRGGVAPHLIVLHYTAMPSAADALARLCDPATEVSAHYLIDLDGTLWSLVPEEARAWHAGAGAWAGCADVNSASIGIELQNRGDHPYPQPQIAALCALVGDLRARHAIAPQGVIGHADLAPTRKADPGPRFDWRALARAGHAVWAEPAATDGPPLGQSLARFGYPPAPADALIAAFRARFRPWARGPEDATDRAIAADLAARFAPVQSATNPPVSGS